MATLHLNKGASGNPAPADPAAQKNAAKEVPAPTPELNPRNQAIASIAARVAESQNSDTAELDSLYGDPQAAQEAPEDDKQDAPTEDAAQDDAPAVEAQDQSPEPEAQVRMVRVKINGEVREVPEDELIETFQKERSAQEKFEAAARMRDEALSVLRQQPAQPQQPTQAPAEMTALVDKIQYGSAEEAAAALQELRSLTVREARQEVSQILLQRELQEFASKNADIWGDDLMRGALLEAESRLAANDPNGSSRRTWESAAKLVRDKLMPQATAPAAVAVVKAAPSADRAQRKASITVVPSAGARVAAPEQQKAPTAQETIEAMRKARMKGRNF